MADEVQVRPQQDQDAAKTINEQLTLEQHIYGDDGKLTHDGMVKLVQAGRSFHYHNMIIWREQDIPSEAQLALGDQKKAAEAARHIDEQIAALNAQRELLGKSEPSLHQGDKGVLSASGGASPGVKPGSPGEGDTAGLDGDAADPKSPAGKAAAKAKADAEKAAEAS